MTRSQQNFYLKYRFPQAVRLLYPKLDSLYSFRSIYESEKSEHKYKDRD